MKYMKLNNWKEMSADGIDFLSVCIAHKKPRVSQLKKKIRPHDDTFQRLNILQAISWTCE